MFMNGLRVTVVGFCFLVLAASAQADPTFLPGFRIGMTIPPAFTAQTYPALFRDASTDSRIAISEYPVQSRAELEAQVVGRPGVRRETLLLQHGTGVLVSSSETAATREWYLLTTTNELTAVIRVGVPAAAASAHSDAEVRKILASTVVRPLSLEERLPALPYLLRERAGLRLSNIVMGIVALTEGPRDDVQDLDQPFLVIAHSARPLPEPDKLDAHARHALQAGVKMSIVTVIKSRPERFRGLAGWELVAEVKDQKGVDGTIVFWMMPMPTGHLQIVGSTKKSTEMSAGSRFLAVRDGIAPR
jgi:hypothetical protein